MTALSITLPMAAVEQAAVADTAMALRSIRALALQTQLSAELRLSYLRVIRRNLTELEDLLCGLDSLPPCVGEGLRDITHDIHRTAAEA